ncbi:hypothetical protein ACOME3_008938 [Neoechinorhynchus agilis]
MRNQCGLQLSNDSILWFALHCQPLAELKSKPVTTSAMQEIDLSYSQRIPSKLEVGLTAAVFTFITIFCLIGNFTIILAIITSRLILTPQNYFLISLAVADLCCSLILLPFHTITYIYQSWLFGFHFCRAFLIFDITLCTASILNLVLVTFDRYLSIRNPIAYRKYRRKQFILFVIFTAWIFSLLIALPVLAVDASQLLTMLSNETIICQMSTNRLFVLFSSTGSFWLPIVIICVLNHEIYSRTIVRLRSRRKEAQAMTVKARTTPAAQKKSSMTKTSSSVEINLIKRAKLAKSREGRLTRTLLVITTLFILCWMPFFMTYVLAAFVKKISELDQVFHNFVLWLGYSNSALNPVIYTASNKDIRHAIQRLGGCTV